MTKSTTHRSKYEELDAILDFAYGAGARRQASRERNATVATFLKNKLAANDDKVKGTEAA